MGEYFDHRSNVLKLLLSSIQYRTDKHSFTILSSDNFWRQSHPPHSLRKIFSYSISVSKYLRVELRKYVSLLGEFVNTCQCLEILSLVSSKESFGKIPKDYVVIYHRTTILYCKYLYLGDVFARNHARSYQ